MLPIFNLVDEWDHFHLWVNTNTVIIDKKWRINMKIYKKHLKKWDEFADLKKIEKQLFDKNN